MKLFVHLAVIAAFAAPVFAHAAGSVTDPAKKTVAEGKKKKKKKKKKDAAGDAAAPDAPATK